jgi:hypothetical protein
MNRTCRGGGSTASWVLRKAGSCAHAGRQSATNAKAARTDRIGPAPGEKVYAMSAPAYTGFPRDSQANRFSGHGRLVDPK